MINLEFSIKKIIKLLADLIVFTKQKEKKLGKMSI
jgi:hypothetical protein